MTATRRSRSRPVHADEARSNKKRLAASTLSETKMWHGGATWGNNNNDDEDDDVEFQDTTTTQKRKSHEIIEIPDSSDENASASEDEDVRQAEVKPSPAKKPKRKVSLPKCAATKAPTNLPPRPSEEGADGLERAAVETL